MAEKEPKAVVQKSETPAEDVSSKIDALIGRINALEQERAEDKETIKMLVEVADNARKENYDKKKGPKKITPIVKLSTIDDHVILAWRTIHDEVYRDDFGVWHEKQVHEYVGVDAEGKEKKFVFNLTELIQQKKVKKIEAEVLERSVSNPDSDSDDQVVTFKVRTVDGGKEYTIDSKFVN